MEDSTNKESEPSPETKKDPNDSGEISELERSIIDKMEEAQKKALKETLKETVAAQPYLVSEKEDSPRWMSLSVGQAVKIDGFGFRISHISKGFLILESDKNRKTTDKEELKEEVWKRLHYVGPCSLLRIDGTPLYVETRILSTAKDQNAAE